MSVLLRLISFIFICLALPTHAQWTTFDPNATQLPTQDQTKGIDQLFNPNNQQSPQNVIIKGQPIDPRLLPPTPLNEQEMQFARTAWSYFIANENDVTGLMPSVAKFKSMTLWDEGGYLLALCSAYKLGIISRDEAFRRLNRVFNSLANLPLYQDEMPNKAYNIQTLEMTDYANKPKPNGIGYSALDIMRLMSGMLVVVQTFPEFTPVAQFLIDKWDFGKLASEHRFQGVAVLGKKKSIHRVQEGRLGYEQYAGSTGLLLGLPVQLAHSYAPILRWQEYFGLRLPGDRRTEQTHGVSAVTTSEPFLLDALEYGWREESFPVAMAVFNAHLLRYERTGILTSLSEDHIKGAPYFAYNSILVDNVPFISVTAKRKDVSHKRGLSAKGSFGWWALTRHPYTYELLDAIKGLQTDGGWMAGLFESDMTPNAIITLNTNAVILEALHYKAFGPLYRY
jgi:hypothetical protein